MPKAVKFDRYGGIDTLYIADVERPVPGEGQVFVRAKAAGINPGEAAMREGAFDSIMPATFPSGQGSDLAKLAAMIADGTLEVPVARVYPLSEVRDAYRELERRHTRGKIVLQP